MTHANQPTNVGSIISDPGTRKIIYGIYAVIGFVIGAVQVGFAAAELGQPVWLTVALAVYGFSGAAFGGLAVTNTPATK